MEKRNLATEVAVIKNQMNNIEKKMDELGEKMDGFIKAAEERFAGKWVEKLMLLVGGAVIVAIIGLIFKK